MMLKNDLELSVTRKKLAGLTEQYELACQDPTLNPTVRKLTKWSIKKLINQLTEEIVRYEAHASQQTL